MIDSAEIVSAESIIGYSRQHSGSPPDPINYLCSLTGVCISQKYFTYCSVQTFQMLFQGFKFTLQNLILRTRLCGTSFMSQHC